MWLLKSRWSNPMKHLIPYLKDDQKAADYLRQLRWPNGVTCPRCGRDAVEPRERCDNGLQRFNCVHCAARLGQQFAMFTDWTSSIFEESKLRPLEWLLVIGLWQLKLNATEIAAAADIQERTAQRCINLLDRGIDETYHLDPREHGDAGDNQRTSIEGPASFPRCSNPEEPRHGGFHPHGGQGDARRGIIPRFSMLSSTTATLSQALHTAALPQPHGLVGYDWWHSRFRPIRAG